MYFVNIYFILGLAMLFVVLWDYKYLPNTASRLVKQPGDKSGFSLVVLSVRNLIVMAIVRIFSLATDCGIGAIRKERKVNKD